MADLQWTDFSFGLDDLLDPIIAGLQAAIDAIKTALEAVKAVFNVLKTLIIDRIDILKASLESILALINQLIESLEEAGIYMLVYAPQGFRNAVTPQQWLTRVTSSLSDPGDRNRPEFTTPQLQAGAVIMSVGLDYDALLTTIKSFLSALFQPFDGRSLSCIAENRDEDGALQFPPFKLDKDCLRSGYSTNVYRGQGTAPDWMKPVLLKDLVPVLGTVATVLKKCVGLFVFGLGLSELIEQYIAFLEAKIAILDGLIAEFDAILALFDALSEIGGISILFFEGTYTTYELQSAILAAGPPPGSESGPYAAVGAMLLVGGGPTATIDLLRGLLGA
jgi:hypothetical protein